MHLLLKSGKSRHSIPETMQLIAGRTGQEYNDRKRRRGAFWEDRYHATAVASDSHFLRCMVYIDMNMVRAGVVSRPEGWPFSGYYEIESPKRRYGLLDYAALIQLLDVKDLGELRDCYRQWIAEALEKHSARESKWTASVAVGSQGFVREVRDRLGLRVKGRQVQRDKDSYFLREALVSYRSNFDPENSDLRVK